MPWNEEIVPEVQWWFCILVFFFWINDKLVISSYQQISSVCAPPARVAGTKQTRYAESSFHTAAELSNNTEPALKKKRLDNRRRIWSSEALLVHEFVQNLTVVWIINKNSIRAWSWLLMLSPYVHFGFCFHGIEIQPNIFSTFIERERCCRPSGRSTTGAILTTIWG